MDILFLWVRPWGRPWESNREGVDGNKSSIKAGMQSTNSVEFKKPRPDVQLFMGGATSSSLNGFWGHYFSGRALLRHRPTLCLTQRCSAGMDEVE